MADGWQLVLGKGPATEPLWTDAEFGDCEIILDCIPGETPPTVLVRGTDATTTLSLAGTPGKWGRFTITIKGRECTVQLGGGEAKRIAIDGTSAKHVLGLGGSAATFANIYVRPL